MDVTPYDVFLGVHVGAGVLGLLLGPPVFAAARRPDRRPALRWAYQAALVVLVVAVAGAVAAHWSDLDTGARAAFGGLVLLGAVIVARGHLALRALRQRRAGWQQRYLDHVYFTYVSLWEGFVLVAILESGLPAWLAPMAAVGILVAGAALLSWYKRRILDPETV